LLCTLIFKIFLGELKMRKLISVAVAGVLFGSVGVSADVPKAEWQEMKAELEAMNQRLQALESENQALRNQVGKAVKVEDLDATNAQVAGLMSKETASSWAEKVQVKGDYRFRYEYIDKEDTDSQTRWRLRARPVIVAKPSSDIEVGFGLATGNNDDPVSSNQTIGGGSNDKPVWVDLAYGTWTGLENTTITAGKMVNPYYTVEKSYLIYDADFRPEGLAIGWTDKTFFANAAYTYIESDSTAPAADGESNYGIPSIQLGVNLVPVTDTTLTLAAGYLDIPTKGHPAIYGGKFQGNSSVKVGAGAAAISTYQYDYHVANASLAFGFSVFDLPLSLYGDYIKNQDANSNDTGYMGGIRLGSAKKKGQWQVAYQYEDLEADATLGEMTDSDFGGGGTDVKGSVVTGQYMITDNWYAGSSVYFDEHGGVDLGSNFSYNRLQIDTGFKY
jgi:hypothetical protein